MPAVFHDLGLWLWRLVPANPILLRVVYAGGRRSRHLAIRVGYLSALALIVVIGVIWVQSNAGASASLADLAKSATQVFKYLSLIQLGLVCILAPLFTAAAITQEKDSQTYSILLSTPLTNGQIVLGSLFSRLFFVFVLLIAGIPLFCILMVYGGVTGDKIALSILLAAATAMLTGSLAISISVIRVGTGRTIFSFYLAIALYLIVVYSLSSWSGLIPSEAQPAPGRDACMSWLAAFHPFLALKVVLGETPAPVYGAVAHYGFPGGYLLAYPQNSYIVMTVLASIVLIVACLFFVRRGAKQGEATLFSRLFSRWKSVGEGGERRRRPRSVRLNPIAWREAVTGAAAGGGYLVRYTMFGAGMVVALTLLVYYAQGSITPAIARAWLYGILATELGVALFIATATAATSMTREKESNTIELILATPLTSSAIIRGKVWGLVNAAGPLLLVPFLTVLLFVMYDLTTGRMFQPAGPAVHAETLITLPVLLICFTAFACMLGLQSSIKSKKTLGAVFTSMGIVIGVFALTAGCAFAIKEQDSPALAAAFMPLTPVTAIYVIIDPSAAVASAGAKLTAGDIVLCRTIAFIASFCSAAVYGLIGLGMHRSMVRNFDMIIRKQSA
jgi:ABC-type transport system involved in multi-copper enzyme maturation permease subunit